MGYERGNVTDEETGAKTTTIWTKPEACFQLDRWQQQPSGLAHLIQSKAIKTCTQDTLLHYSFFFLSSSCFSFLFNVKSLVQLSLLFYFQCRRCTFCFLGLIFWRRATYVIMLFVSTNLYHRHVCPLSCFKSGCVLCKVLLALIFHPQDIFYFCSFLFLSISLFLFFPHFVWNTLNEAFSFYISFISEFCRQGIENLVPG